MYENQIGLTRGVLSSIYNCRSGFQLYQYLANLNMMYSGIFIKQAEYEYISAPPPSTQIYPRELPLGSQSHSRISSSCVCARVPFVRNYSFRVFNMQGDEVYENQIVGIHQRANDLKVNICRQKQLTNMRSAGENIYVCRYIYTSILVPVDIYIYIYIST